MNQYHFVTRWRVEGTRGEVADVLRDATTLPRWWPSVYLDVQEIEPRLRYRMPRDRRFHRHPVP